MKRATMELGGHAPVMIFDDADLDKAIEITAMSKFRNAGQVCVAPTRFLIQDGIADKFMAGFVKAAEASRSATASRMASAWDRLPTSAAFRSWKT